MKATGPRNERETVIFFNEEDEPASIWTASGTVYRRLLKRLGSDYLIEDGERHAIFACPRNWLILPRVKARRASTPTQRSNLGGKVAKPPIPPGQND